MTAFEKSGSSLGLFRTSRTKPPSIISEITRASSRIGASFARLAKEGSVRTRLPRSTSYALWPKIYTGIPLLRSNSSQTQRHYAILRHSVTVRRGSGTTFALSILKDSILLPDSEMVKLHNSAAALIGYVLFYRFEARASLLLSIFGVTFYCINIVLALREKQQRVAYTLCY